MIWLKRLGAVAAGFAATALLSVGTDASMHGTGVFPPVGERMSDAMFVIPAVYRAVFTVAGGWITARLAPDHPWRHAAALMALGAVGGLAGVSVALAHPELGPAWYAWTIPASAVPCIGLGAAIHTRRR